MAKRCGVNRPCHRGIKGGLFSPFFNNGTDLSGYGLGPGPASTPPGGGGVGVDNLLKEDGFNLLLEDGNLILLE